MNPDLHKLYQGDQRLRRLLDTSRKLEGLPAIPPHMLPVWLSQPGL